MSDEWENKFHEYEEEVGSSSVSEKGFLTWLPATERTRGKQALQSALVQNILSSEDLRIKNYLKRPGVKSDVEITEQQLKTKLVEKLLVMDPSSGTGEDAQVLRDQEAANIIECLNLFSDGAFEPKEEASELTVQEKERARRLTYQASLAYVATLIRQLWFHTAKRAEGKTPMTDDMTEVQWGEVRQGVERLINHPAWTAPYEDDRMKRLKLALEKNQEVPKALEELGLDLSYLLLGRSSTTFKNVWKPSD